MEGISTPYGGIGHHQERLDLGQRSLYDVGAYQQTRHPLNPEDEMSMMQDGGMRHEKSHWSITVSDYLLGWKS